MLAMFVAFSFDRCHYIMIIVNSKIFVHAHIVKVDRALDFDNIAKISAFPVHE